ncbi:MAG: hypothetical protein WC449_05510 [Candidatus Paceibacterota bacterium]
MRKIFGLILLAVILMLPIEALAAGSCTVTITQKDSRTTRYAFAWTASAGGAVTGVGYAYNVTGFIYSVEFWPGAVVPTNHYDVTFPLLSPAGTTGADILKALGTDCPIVVTDSDVLRCPVTTWGYYPFYYNATISPVIADAGAGATGTIYIDVAW